MEVRNEGEEEGIPTWREVKNNGGEKRERSNCLKVLMDRISKILRVVRFGDQVGVGKINPL